MKQQNYKIGDRILIFAGAVILAVILFGCSARKVERSKTETKETATTEQTFKDSSKTVTKLDSNTKIVDISESEEIEIIPIDNTKEIVVNGKKYFNAKIIQVNNKNNITTNKSKNVSQIKQNDIKKSVKTNKSKTAKSNTKHSDKKQYDWTKTIIVISIILGIAIWLIYFFYFSKAKKDVEKVTYL